MIHLLSSSLGRFRVLGILEGLSFILLLGIAMPLKYFAGIPEAVKVVGMVHGVLFIFYVLLLIVVCIEYGWKLKLAMLVFAASLIPFATFYVDRSMLSKMQH